MKLLVIGGSYFYGRVFVMEAAKAHEITVWNRGTYSMEAFGVRQIRADTPRSSIELGPGKSVCVCTRKYGGQGKIS